MASKKRKSKPKKAKSRKAPRKTVQLGKRVYVLEPILRKRRKKAAKRKVHKKIKKIKKKVKAVAEAMPTAYKRVYSEYKNKILGVVTEFLEKELGVIIEWTKDAMNIRKRIRNITIYLILIFAGAVCVLCGIAEYIQFLCPQLARGIAHVLVGLIAIAGGILYSRVSSSTK